MSTPTNEEILRILDYLDEAIADDLESEVLDFKPWKDAKGTYKLRVGKNCMPLDPRSFVRTQIASGAVDWSGQPARGVAFTDLDPVEIARARNVLSRYDPEADLLHVDDTQFLTGLGVVRDGQVTHAGLLLFGREPLLNRLCPQHEVHYVYQISDTEVARNESYRWGLIHILERIDDLFAGPTNPERELLMGLFMMRIPPFPPTAVREAWLNAVTHRDYSDPGEVLIRQTEREVVVVSPGGFLSGITPRNILRREPRSRNRALAEAFQKLRLVERAGIGRRRIFMPMLLQLSRRDARAVLERLAGPETELPERRGEGEAARYYLTPGVAKMLLGESR